MELLKTIMMVSGAAAAGSFIGDTLDTHLTPKLGATVNGNESAKRAVRLGYTASGAVITYGLLRAVF